MIIYPKLAKESGLALAKTLNLPALNPFEIDNRDFTQHKLVFNYGCNRNIKYNNIINTAKAVALCKDKLLALEALSNACLPTPNFTNNPKFTEGWADVVIRKKKDGHGADNLEYSVQGEILPVAELYTEYYKHKHEFRIVIFLGKVVGRYKKHRKGKDWILEEQDPFGFEEIDNACLKAAQILGIDYVGFDVLSNTQTQFVILEANSAPILTPEVEQYIKDWYAKTY